MATSSIAAVLSSITIASALPAMNTLQSTLTSGSSNILSENTATPTATPKPKPKPKSGLTSGAKIGIAVGIVVFAAICFLLLFIFLRRKKSRRSAHGTATHLDNQNASNSQQLSAGRLSGNALKAPTASGRDAYTNEIPTSWYEQPKDDDAMIRLFREVDGRLTDHVLNFYVVADDETYDSDPLPKELQQELERRVSNVGFLLSQHESRAFVLCAILADRIMKAVVEETQVLASASRAPRNGAQTGSSSLPGNERRHNYEFPENIKLSITQAAHEETRSFAVGKPKTDARFRSLEAVVKCAGDFALTMERQPTRFELVWPPYSTGGSSNTAVFDPQTMESVHRVPRAGASGPEMVRGAVFPGLQKFKGERESRQGTILSKIKVFLC